MKPKHLLAAAAVATGISVSSQAGAVTTVDLGFIMDESGSVGSTNYYAAVLALKTAISQIPYDDPNVTYRVGVISFGATADVVAAPTVFNSQAARDGVLALLQDEGTPGGARGYGTPSGITNSTNYSAAFTALNSAFGTLGDLSIINMTTDGVNNAGASDSAVKTQAAALQTASGWDVLSFEAVGSSLDTGYMQSIGFGDAGQGNCDYITTAAGITSAAHDCFVLKVNNYSEYENAILTKVQKTVIDTGGNPNVVPLPAGLPLLLAGIGAIAGLRFRSKKKA